ncbi:MAG: anthranilate synthase component I [Actinomycetota bacterium]
MNSAFPDLATFEALVGQHAVVPVAREFFADTLTPVAAYRAVREPWSFLLESVEHGERWGRFSFIGTSPALTVRVLDGVVSTEPAVTTGEGLLGTLRGLLHELSAPDLPGLPPLHSGLVGYVGYDTVREIERLEGRPPADLGIPETALMLPRTVIAFDHLKQKVTIVANAIRPEDPARAHAEALERIQQAAERLFSARADAPRELVTPLPIPAVPNVDDDAYAAWVERAKEHVFAGDIFQVVLSRRFTADAPADPFDAYRALRTINPSPYMYYLDMGEVQIAGSSPEVLVKVQGGVAVTHPIAGTRRRGADEDEDAALEAELLADPKERAEHVMLVDLARNDLGRVSAPGTVNVEDLMVIERYSHVMHIASRVSGTLATGMSALDAFSAAFPAGTVSGAPKVRAMQIIDETEPVARGPYAGAVGYFDLAGNLDTCITLRTVLFHGGKAHVQAGAGIVADSDPVAEAKETRDKAQALLAAVGAATRLT